VLGVFDGDGDCFEVAIACCNVVLGSAFDVSIMVDSVESIIEVCTDKTVIVLYHVLSS
jgi:hypothetical protein